MKYQPLKELPTDKAFLHFECVKLAGEEWQVDYELVLPLTDLDMRGTYENKGKADRPKHFKMRWLDQRNNLRFPLGRTLIGTARSSYPFRTDVSGTRIELPFRDGAHAFWDNERLGGLPMIYTKGEAHWLLLPEPTSSNAAR